MAKNADHKLHDAIGELPFVINVTKTDSLLTLIITFLAGDDILKSYIVMLLSLQGDNTTRISKCSPKTQLALKLGSLHTKRKSNFQNN